MAYLQDDEQDENAQGLNQTLAPSQTAQPEQEQQPAQPQQTSQPATIGSSASPTTQASSSPTQVNQKAGSGTFTNLKKYLQANQGNRIASAATQKVANLGTGAQRGIQTAQTGFGQKVEQGTLKDRQKAVQDVTATTQAARQVQAQQPQQQQGVLDVNTPTANAAATAAPAPTPQVTQPQYLTDEQKNRFAEVINAQYEGPESIRQAGLLQPALERVQEASRQIRNTQSTQGREELLRSMFAKNRDYTQGQSKLDALLLNTSQQGVNQLQQAAKAGGNLQQQLQQAENLSQNLAKNRAQEIAGIREQARNVFTGERTAEEQATEQRITDLIETPAKDEGGNPIPKLDAKGNAVLDPEGKPVYLTEWERLPEHFRQSLMNKSKSNKVIKAEQIAGLKEQYAPQIQAYNAAKVNVDNLQKQASDLNRRIVQASFKISEDNANGGPIDSAAERKFLEKAAPNLEKLKQQLNQSKKELLSIEKSPEYKQYQAQVAQANKMNMNQWVLSPEEAAILGVASGEGLYNMRPDDIRTVQAEREKLITQDEFARQQALAQLAGLDAAKLLQKDLKYKDQSKAGTQNLMSALDTEAFRNQLNEAQRLFEESAEGATLTGVGKKKVSRGNMFGKKTKTYKAQVKGNVADMLKQAGYDIDKIDPGQAQSILTDEDMLSRFLGATDTQRAEQGNVGFSGAEGSVTGAGVGTTVGSAVPGVGTGIGAAIGAGVGGAVGTNSSLDNLQYTSDMLKELEEKFGIKGAGAIGQAIQTGRSKAGDLAGTYLQLNPFTNVVDDVGKKLGLGSLSSGIAGAIGGIDTGAMKAYGSAIAKRNAIMDLEKKYANYLKGQGFANRANIADTETTRARTQALLDLLSRKG